MEILTILFIVLTVVTAVLVGCVVYLMFFKDDESTIPNVNNTVHIDVDRELIKLKNTTSTSDLHTELASKATITASDLEPMIQVGYTTADDVVLQKDQLVSLSDSSNVKLIHLSDTRALTPEVEFATRMAVDLWSPYQKMLVGVDGDNLHQQIKSSDPSRPSGNVLQSGNPFLVITTLAGNARTNALYSENLSFTRTYPATSHENRLLFNTLQKPFYIVPGPANDDEIIIKNQGTPEQGYDPPYPVYYTRYTIRTIDVSDITFSISGTYTESYNGDTRDTDVQVSVTAPKSILSDITKIDEWGHITYGYEMRGPIGLRSPDPSVPAWKNGVFASEDDVMRELTATLPEKLGVTFTFTRQLTVQSGSYPKLVDDHYTSSLPLVTTEQLVMGTPTEVLRESWYANESAESTGTATISTVTFTPNSYSVTVVPKFYTVSKNPW